MTFLIPLTVIFFFSPPPHSIIFFPKRTRGSVNIKDFAGEFHCLISTEPGSRANMWMFSKLLLTCLSPCLALVTSSTSQKLCKEKKSIFQYVLVTLKYNLVLSCGNFFPLKSVITDLKRASLLV